MQPMILQVGMKRNCFLRTIALSGLLCLFATSLGSEKKNEKPVKVAALHPVLGDLVKRIGGSHVEVVNLLPPNGNLHSFDPTPDALRQAAKSTLIFASGKNIEPYLPKLKDSLSPDCKLIDVGQSIPDVEISADNAAATCCEDHDHDHEHNHGSVSNQEAEEFDGFGNCKDHGLNEDPIAARAKASPKPVDPHWWHSMDNIKRAARVIEQSLSEKIPTYTAEFSVNRAAVEKECDKLSAKAKRQLMAIPTERRLLITGHAAFGHLCKELDFRQIAVQGASREDEGAARHLAEMLKKIRQEKAIAVFPEYQANPKVLEEIAKSLNLKTGKPLVSDGTAPHAHTFDTMFRYNIDAIVEALADKKN